MTLLQARPQLRLIVAGRQPSAGLGAFAKTLQNVELIADPSTVVMHQLIRGAQVVLLRANHDAGYKIKLIESLALGRHVIANAAVVHGAPGLTTAVTPAETDAEWLVALDKVWTEIVTLDDCTRRVDLMRTYLRGPLADQLVEKIAEATFNRN